MVYKHAHTNKKDLASPRHVSLPLNINNSLMNHNHTLLKLSVWTSHPVSLIFLSLLSCPFLFSSLNPTFPNHLRLHFYICMLSSQNLHRCPCIPHSQSHWRPSLCRCVFFCVRVCYRLPVGPQALDGCFRLFLHFIMHVIIWYLMCSCGFFLHAWERVRYVVVSAVVLTV